MQRQGSNSNNKRLFVRPFEDDFQSAKKDTKGSATGNKKKSGKDSEETATLHYGDDVRVKLPISSLQGRQQQDHQNEESVASSCPVNVQVCGYNDNLLNNILIDIKTYFDSPDI